MRLERIKRPLYARYLAEAAPHAVSNTSLVTTYGSQLALGLLSSM